MNSRVFKFSMGVTVLAGIALAWSLHGGERARTAKGPSEPSLQPATTATRIAASDPVARRRELFAQRGKRRTAPATGASATAVPEAEAPPPPPLLIPEARAEEILSVAGTLSSLPEVERFTEHLTQEARGNGKVDTFSVLEGLTAIRQLGFDLTPQEVESRELDFLRDLGRIAMTEDGAAPTSELGPSLASYTRNAHLTREPGSFGEVISAYRNAISPYVPEPEVN